MDVNNEPVINFKNSMGLISNDRQMALEAATESIKNSIMEVQTIIEENNDTDYLDPDTGHKIVNATDNKIWVAQNVAFIFSTGAIFDKNDKAFLDSVIDFFNSNNNSYLPCVYKTYSYTSDVIQKFEKLEAIGNGNYHMVCFIICYATNETLPFAPESMFSHRGICESLIDDTEIRDEISRLMGLYGFTKQIYIQPSSVSKIGSRDNKTLPDIKLQYDTEIEYNEPTNRELMSNLKTKESTIGTRSNIKGTVNGQRTYPRAKHQRIGIGNDITNRIAADQIESYTMPTETLGINIRINNDLESRLKSTERTNQFKVFDTEQAGISETIQKDNQDNSMPEEMKHGKYNHLMDTTFFDTSGDIPEPSNFMREEQNRRMEQLNKNNGDFRYINYGRR